MSWSQRLSQISGRFSPWARSQVAEDGSAKVSDGDYSYITADDLKNGDYDRNNGPPRDTDRLTFRHKSTPYTIHFPAYSIDRGELTVGQIREQAAKKIGCDSRRLKLLSKGKSLKDDSRTCREEGLRDGLDVLCVASDSLLDQDSSASENEDAAKADGQNADDQSKRKRNRTRNKKKKGKSRGNAQDTPEQDPSAAASPKPAVPKTPTEKLNALHETLKTLIPGCDSFIAHPPLDPPKREFEYKRLSETILTQVLIKLDGVETDDADERAKRKALVKEAQNILNELDAAK